MKLKSPWLLFFLFVVSAGQFAWIWLIFLMSDVNKIDERKIPVPLIGGVLAVLWLVHAILYFEVMPLLATTNGPPPPLFDVVIAVGLCFVAAVIATLIFIERRVRQCAGMKYSILRALGTGAIAFLGIPFLLIQMRINALRTSRSQ